MTPRLMTFDASRLNPATYPAGVPSAPRHGIISYAYLQENAKYRTEPTAVETREPDAAAGRTFAGPSVIRVGEVAASADRVELTSDEEGLTASGHSRGWDEYLGNMARKEQALFGHITPTHEDYRAKHGKNKKGDRPHAKLPWQALFRPDEKAEGPTILAFRANGMEPQKKAEWRSDRDRLEDAREDTRALVDIVQEAVPFIDSLHGESILARFFLPQGFHFAQKTVRILVGADPTPGDEEGFGNASASMDEVGNLDLMSGADPKPGSDPAKVFAPVWKDKGVFRHEMGHTLVDEIYRAFGLQLDYSYQAGAGFHEAFADCFKIAMGQMIDLKGARLTDEGHGRHFLIGEVMVIGAALRHGMFPGTARKADHDMGPDLQEGHLDGFSNSDPVHQKMIQVDLGGVHHKNSIANRGFALTTLGIEDRENAKAALRMFMGAQILAAAMGNTAAPYFEQSQLWIASAYVEFGMKAAENARVALEQVGAIPQGLPSTADMIKEMKIDELVDRIRQEGIPAVTPSLSKRRRGGR